MGTEIAQRVQYPAPTPQIAKSLSPQALREHRAAIAFEVKTVLSAYFQPHESDEIRASQLAWWCDELQDWTREQVVWALRTWNRENSRARPTPGDVLGICLRKRGEVEAAKIRAIAKPPPEPDRPPISDEEKQRAQDYAASFISSRFPSNRKTPQ